MNQENSNEAVGLARFHKLTISLGVVFLLLMVWRYWRQYQLSESPRHMAFGIVAGLGAVVLALYLRAFWRRGI